jgi:hypothetical protein
MGHDPEETQHDFRRTFRYRVSKDVSVSIKGEHERHAGTILDISRSGLRLALPYRAERSQVLLVEVTFRYDDCQELKETLEGEVIKVESSSTGSICRIAFQELITPMTHPMVCNYLENLLRGISPPSAA